MVIKSLIDGIRRARPPRERRKRIRPPRGFAYLSVVDDFDYGYRKLPAQKLWGIFGGFVSDITAAETARNTGVTVRTVNSHFGRFRRELLIAALDLPSAFFGLGKVLRDVDQTRVLLHPSFAGGRLLLRRREQRGMDKRKVALHLVELVFRELAQMSALKNLGSQVHDEAQARWRSTAVQMFDPALMRDAAISDTMWRVRVKSATSRLPQTLERYDERVFDAYVSVIAQELLSCFHTFRPPAKRMENAELARALRLLPGLRQFVDQVL